MNTTIIIDPLVGQTKRFLMNSIIYFVKKKTNSTNINNLFHNLFKKLVKYIAKGMRKLVERAIDHWQTFTCVRFETYDPVKHANYRSLVYIQNAEM